MNLNTSFDNIVDIRYNLDREIAYDFYDWHIPVAVDKLTERVVATLPVEHRLPVFTALRKIDNRYKDGAMQLFLGKSFGGVETLELEEELIKAGMTRKQIWEITELL
jgi:hypothetical protein